MYSLLHLVVNKEFNYLNYLSVMSAVRGNKVKIWVIEEPTTRYWDLVKKVKSIDFIETTKEAGINLKATDKTGRLDVIYLGKLTDRYVEDFATDHTGIYEENGEFEAKDMCLVHIKRPEVVTLDYIRENKTTLANLVHRVLLRRVWEQ